MKRLTLDYGKHKRNNGILERDSIIRSALVLDEGHKVRNFMSMHYQLASQLCCQKWRQTNILQHPSWWPAS